MIKAVATDSQGKPVLILGLSGENMVRLMAEEPILIEAEALGLPPLSIVICGGRTEAEIEVDLFEVVFGSKKKPPH